MTPDEYASRRAKAQDRMQAAGLDALLFTTEAEIQYFTGFLTRFWQSPCRPWFLVLPANDDPIAIIPAIGAEVMAATGIKDIRTWPAPRPEDEGISLLLDALKTFAKTGTPMGTQASLRMPLQDWAQIIAHNEITDDANIVRDLRMIKSDAEVQAIQQACAVANRAFDRVPEIASKGISLAQVFRDFQSLCLQEGADWVPYVAGASEQGGYGDVISPASDKPLAAGDVLMLDTGLIRGGYFCDFDRNWAIGHVAPDTQAAYSKLITATDAAFEAVKPGAKAADLWQAMASIVGATETGRLGHGLGINLTEWPSLTATDETVLAEGMVLTLEPSIEILNGRMLVHEENIVVTATGAKWLSRRAPSELPVLA